MEKKVKRNKPSVFLVFVPFVFCEHEAERRLKEKNMYIIPVRSSEQSKSQKVMQQVEQVSSGESSHLLVCYEF